MKSTRWLLPLLALSACPPPPVVTPDEDAGAEARPVFDGPTQNSGIPDLPEDFVFDASIPAIDSGTIVVDTRCCTTNFSIADQEAAGGVVGELRLALPTFPSGLALTRGGGRWRATACFPVNQSATYRYEFTWDAGLIDGGQVEDDDGGIIGLELLDVRHFARASDEEPGFTLDDGSRTNFFRSVSSCDGLDGSVPP